MIPDT